MKTISLGIRLLMWLWAIPFVAQGQFIFTTNNGAITITGCTNAAENDGTLVIPDTINDLPVVSIDYYACSYKGMTNVTIGNNITNIGPYAFWSCIYLRNVTVPKNVTTLGALAFGGCGGASGGSGIEIFFQGDKPVFEGDVLTGGAMYYLAGAIGWEGSGAVLWNPQVQTGDSSFGVRSNQFGFKIFGTADIPIVVDACTNLGSGASVQLASGNLTNGIFDFRDPDWSSYPSRFYRIRSP